MAQAERREAMKRVALAKGRDELSRYLRLAEKDDIVITRHGKPARVLIGFRSEEDCFDYCLESDPRFLRRIERALQSLRAGRCVRLDDVKP
jgi:prevent-host-death family protein